MSYSFTTKPNTAATVTIPVKGSTVGATITVEFAESSTFRSLSLIKQATGAGSTVTVSLTAADVQLLTDSYYRVKAVKDGKTSYIQDGRVDYEEVRTYESPAAMIGTDGKIKSELLPTSIKSTPGRVYGATGGRVLSARLDKSGTGGGTQTLTAWQVNPLTMGEITEVTGLNCATPGAIKIAPGAAGKYRITSRLTFAGGTSGVRIGQILVNGVNIAEGAFTGTSGNIQVNTDDIWLSEGDVVTLGAYCETASVTVVGDFPLKTWISLVRNGVVPVRPTIITNSGSAIAELGRAAMGDWTWRNSWTEVANMDALFYPGNDSSEWLPNNPNGFYNIGTALIPDARPQTEWPAMLDEVIAGTRDSVFTTQGRNLAKYGTSNMVIRPMWEPNMFNSTQLDPAKYKAAFNRAVPLIRAGFAAEAPNKRLRVAYCWLDAGGSPHRDYYPGDANVDIIDMDLYSRIWRSTEPTKAELLNATRLRLEELARFATQRGKPMGISEWGLTAKPAGGTTDWGLGDVPEWIDLVFDWIEQNNPEYAIYFNITDGAGMALNSTPASKARYIERAKLLT